MKKHTQFSNQPFQSICQCMDTNCLITMLCHWHWGSDIWNHLCTEVFDSLYIFLTHNSQSVASMVHWNGLGTVRWFCFIDRKLSEYCKKAAGEERGCDSSCFIILSNLMLAYFPLTWGSLQWRVQFWRKPEGKMNQTRLLLPVLQSLPTESRWGNLVLLKGSRSDHIIHKDALKAQCFDRHHYHQEHQ